MNIEGMEKRIQSLKQRLNKPVVEGVPEHMIHVEDAQILETIRELENEIAQFRRPNKKR